MVFEELLFPVGGEGCGGGRTDRLYQHSLDCVILAWDSCPFPAPCLPVPPRGRDEAWIWELIWVKGKKKGGKRPFLPLLEGFLGWGGGAEALGGS